MPSAPTGVRLTDGFPSKLTFPQALGISLWEREVTPPGADMGGPNDTTTMRNSFWRTHAPKKLRTLTPLTYTAQYDPKVYGDIMNQLGNPQALQVQFPNGAVLTFWGYLDKFMPQRMKDGEPPLAEVTVQPTNQDLSGVEVAPTFAGTSSTTATTTTTLAG